MVALCAILVPPGKACRPCRAACRGERHGGAACLYSAVSLTHSLTHTRLPRCLQVLGTLANLTERDLPEKHTFASILTEFSMIEFLYKQLVPGFADDDIVLEVVMLIGQCAAEQDAALLFARSNMPKILNTTLAGAGKRVM